MTKKRKNKKEITKKNPRAAGRPAFELDEWTLEKVLELRRVGISVKKISLAFKYDYSTLWRYLKNLT